HRKRGSSLSRGTMTGSNTAQLGLHVSRDLHLDMFSLTLASGHRAEEDAYCSLTLTSNGRGSFCAAAPKNARFIEALALSSHLPFIGLSISSRLYSGIAKVRLLGSKESEMKGGSLPSVML